MLPLHALDRRVACRRLCRRVGVHLAGSVFGVAVGHRTNLPLASGHGDVDKSSDVDHPLAGAALGRLLLLLRLDLDVESVDASDQALLRRLVYDTFGVCDLTLPARAREPCTLPMIAV
jgi:hypothetical protein